LRARVPLRFAKKRRADHARVPAHNRRFAKAFFIFLFLFCWWPRSR